MKQLCLGGNIVVLIVLTLVNPEETEHCMKCLDLKILSILSLYKGLQNLCESSDIYTVKTPARHECSENARTFSSGDAFVNFNKHVDILRGSTEIIEVE